MNDNIQVLTPANNKTRDLFLGILFDVIGMLTYAVPFFGEFADVIWAPVSGILMMWLYKGNVGKIGGIFSVIEELLP